MSSSPRRPRLPHRPRQESEASLQKSSEQAAPPEGSSERDQPEVRVQQEAPSEESASSVAVVRINDPQKVSPLDPEEESDAEEELRRRLEQRKTATVTDLGQRRRTVDRRRRADRRRKRRSKLTRWSMGVSLALIALLVLGWAIFFSPLLAVREISVVGTDRVDGAALEEALSPVKGTPLTRISEDQVRRLIGENVLIKDLSVEALPPHELQVTVKERMPVAIVEEGGQYVLVDGQGVALGAVKSPEQAEVPLVDGGLDAVSKDSFRELVTVLKSLPQSLLERMQRAEAKDSSDLRLIMRDGSTVRWGTSEQSHLKARVLEKLLGALEEKGIPVKTIDVSSPEHPVVS